MHADGPVYRKRQGGRNGDGHKPMRAQEGDEGYEEYERRQGDARRFGCHKLHRHPEDGLGLMPRPVGAVPGCIDGICAQANRGASGLGFANRPALR
jgi:hypothetical protein